MRNTRQMLAPSSLTYTQETCIPWRRVLKENYLGNALTEVEMRPLGGQGRSVCSLSKTLGSDCAACSRHSGQHPAHSR